LSRDWTVFLNTISIAATIEIRTFDNNNNNNHNSSLVKLKITQIFLMIYKKLHKILWTIKNKINKVNKKKKLLFL